MLLHNILSNIFPPTGGKDSGQSFFKFFLSSFLSAGAAIASLQDYGIG